VIIESHSVLFFTQLDTGEQIRLLRKKLKLTQQEFADILHVEKLTIVRWELNQRNCKGPALKLINILNKYDLWRTE
jgi:putative transcriptional regulator